MNTMTRDEAARLLGVAAEATADEIAAAWRQTARRTHPDAGGDAEEFTKAAIAAELLQTAPTSNPHHQDDDRAEGEGQEEDGLTDQTDPASIVLPIPVVNAQVKRVLDVKRAVAGLASILVVIVIVVVGAAATSLVIVPVIITGAGCAVHTLWAAWGRPHLWSLVHLPGKESPGTASTTTTRSTADEFANRRRRTS